MFWQGKWIPPPIYRYNHHSIPLNQTAFPLLSTFPLHSLPTFSHALTHDTPKMEVTRYRRNTTGCFDLNRLHRQESSLNLSSKLLARRRRSHKETGIRINFTAVSCSMMQRVRHFAILNRTTVSCSRLAFFSDKNYSLEAIVGLLDKIVINKYTRLRHFKLALRMCVKSWVDGFTT